MILPLIQTVSQSLQLTHFFSSTTAILKNSGESVRGCMEIQSKGQISTQNSQAVQVSGSTLALGIARGLIFLTTSPSELTMASTGQWIPHTPQSIQRAGSMLNIDFFSPAMASVGHLTSQSVQPMQVLRMVCGTANPFIQIRRRFFEPYLSFAAFDLLIFYPRKSMPWSTGKDPLNSYRLVWFSSFAILLNGP